MKCLYKVFYEKIKIGGTNGRVEKFGINVTALGNAVIEDVDNSNQGYPILAWQKNKIKKT